MRKILLLLCLCCVGLSFLRASGDKNPVRWEYFLERLSDTHYQIRIQAHIPPEWHIYDTEALEDIDPVTFIVNDNQIQPTLIRRQKAVSVTITDPIFENKKISVLRGDNDWLVDFNFEKENIPKKIKILVQYNCASETDFLSEEFPFDVFLSEDGKNRKMDYSLKISNINIDNPVVHFDAGKSTVGAKSDAGAIPLFFLGFVGGLLALFTPCVFPMIPLTISFFSKSGTTKKESIRMAMLYGFSVVVIYAILSVPFHVLDKLNPNILNSVATSPFLNLVFFVLFVFFALSFFGFYEITLPSNLGNMADSKSRTQKRIGIFFMALTLCIVSFSCTGPILGSLLAGSLSNAEGGAMALTWGLLGFGFAFALPFTLLAFFPHSLSKLPKSGGWMNTFKVSLGFVELAFAFKFLSNTDLIWHWGFLKREVFIACWVVLGILYFLYLIGKIPLYEKEKNIGIFRKIWAVCILVFTVYMALAFPKEPITKLELLSGFAPPEFYSVYQKDNNCALGLNCVQDYEAGLALAKKSNKPMLLDFTGWACVNCRKMEEHVWSDPVVYQIIKDKFILVSLYVDDRKKLPVEQQLKTYTTVDKLETQILTVGDKWSVFETENFKNNAQPLYAVIDPDEHLVITPVGYLPKVALYQKWLQTALDVLYDQK